MATCSSWASCLHYLRKVSSLDLHSLLSFTSNKSGQWGRNVFCNNDEGRVIVNFIAVLSSKFPQFEPNFLIRWQIEMSTELQLILWLPVREVGRDPSCLLCMSVWGERDIKRILGKCSEVLEEGTERRAMNQWQILSISPEELVTQAKSGWCHSLL